MSAMVMARRARGSCSGGGGDCQCRCLGLYSRAGARGARVGERHRVGLSDSRSARHAARSGSGSGWRSARVLATWHLTHSA